MFLSFIVGSNASENNTVFSEMGRRLFLRQSPVLNQLISHNGPLFPQEIYFLTDFFDAFEPIVKPPIISPDKIDIALWAKRHNNYNFKNVWTPFGKKNLPYIKDKFQQVLLRFWQENSGGGSTNLVVGTVKEFDDAMNPVLLSPDFQNKIEARIFKDFKNLIATLTPKICEEIPSIDMHRLLSNEPDDLQKMYKFAVIFSKIFTLSWAYKNNEYELKVMPEIKNVNTDINVYLDNLYKNEKNSAKQDFQDFIERITFVDNIKKPPISPKTTEEKKPDRRKYLLLLLPIVLCVFLYIKYKKKINLYKEKIKKFYYQMKQKKKNKAKTKKTNQAIEEKIRTGQDLRFLYQFQKYK